MMKVRVKLLSPAGDMPKGFDEFGEAEMDVPAGATLAAVMERINLPREEAYTSLVSGQSIVPDDRAGFALSDGDEVTLLPAIQGGRGHSRAFVPSWRRNPRRDRPDRRRQPA